MRHECKPCQNIQLGVLFATYAQFISYLFLLYIYNLFSLICDTDNNAPLLWARH